MNNPIVIMPAYGCPDLVAAARYAGAEPYFVDLERNSFMMDLTALRAVLEENAASVAVIGVDLFGYSERWQEIGRLCDEHDVVCVRDCAQSLQSQESIESDIESHVRIYSFGRGKPLFLQGGGAALVASRRDQRLSKCFDQVVQDLPRRRHVVSHLVNALYNTALQPRFYAVLALLLGDRLGVTRYESLEALESLKKGFDAVANEAIRSFWKQNDNKQDDLVRMLKEIGTADGSPFSFFDTDIASDCRLLRMPLLMRSGEERDRCVDAMLKCGIGATPMYGRALPAIEGVEVRFDISQFPVASDIAARLMTLPVHARMQARDFGAIKNTLKGLTST